MSRRKQFIADLDSADAPQYASFNGLVVRTTVDVTEPFELGHWLGGEASDRQAEFFAGFSGAIDAMPGDAGPMQLHYILASFGQLAPELLRPVPEVLSVLADGLAGDRS